MGVRLHRPLSQPLQGHLCQPRGQMNAFSEVFFGHRRLTCQLDPVCRNIAPVVKKLEDSTPGRVRGPQGCWRTRVTHAWRPHETISSMRSYERSPEWQPAEPRNHSIFGVSAKVCCRDTNCRSPTCTPSKVMRPPWPCCLTSSRPVASPPSPSKWIGPGAEI